jgi:predicted porin
MNKSLWAAAALWAGASLACAQSSVTLFGLVDANLYRKQLAGETARLTQGSGGMTTSFFGFRGVEDLGDGLKATFMVTGFFNNDTGQGGRATGDAMWSRSAWLALAAERWGTLRLGRQQELAYQNLLRYSSFDNSTAFGPSAQHTYIPSAAQPMMTGSGATDSGWSNAVGYVSPSFGGVVVSAMAGIGEAGTDGNRSAIGINYQAGGPWAAGVVVEQVDRMNLNFSKPPANLPMNRSRLVNAGTSYDFGRVKLYGQVVRSELESDAGSHIVLKTGQVGAVVPVAEVHRVLFAYAHTDKDQRGVADQRRDTVSLAYDHVLSKRTDLYAVAMHDRVTALESGLGWAVGIRHRF